MKKFSFIIASLVALLGVTFAAQPVVAAEKSTCLEPAKTLATFTISEASTPSSASLQIGSNLLFAGNDIMEETTVRGILFALGGNISLNTKSEYSFIAGNTVKIKGEVEKDLFAAGNSIQIEKTAQIGRDVYAAANDVTVEADLPGDFSASADVVVLDNVTINGDVDLAVSRLVIRGNAVEIKGTLVINADAEVVTSASTFDYNEIEKYEIVHYDLAPAALITVKMLSIVSLFVVMLILLIIFPHIDKKVAKEVSATQFLVNMMIGFCVLVIIPILIIFMLLTIIAAPAALLLLVAYIILVYLAQGFTGLWLGKVIIEKIFGWDGHKLFEALLGIVILGFASLAPYAGGWIGFISLILGLGLIVQSIRNKQIGGNVNWGPLDSNETSEAETAKGQTASKARAKRSSQATKTSTRKTAAKKPKVVKEE